jgi:3',5'-cyclic AMP phosphodiesterase CpdA
MKGDMRMNKNWLSKVAIVLLLVLVLVLPASVQAVDSPLSTAGDRDGGIGISTNYLNGAPGISLNPKVKQIIYPLFSTPAIQKKGQSLTVKVDSKGKQAGAWSVKLKQTNNSSFIIEYDLPVQTVSMGQSYWNKSSTIYDVTVQIPSQVPEKLYDLEVTYTGNGMRLTDKQPHSVKVVDQFKKDFTFLHMTDIHVGSPRNLGDPSDPTAADPALAAEAGIWNPDPGKRWLYLQKTIKEVNLKNPDFVVLTGDLMFGQMNPQEYIYEYEEVYKVLQQLNVPVYLIPGNHDGYAQDGTLTDGLDYWTKYFGPQYFSFNYGPYAHFVGLNSFDWDKIDRSGTGTVLVPTWGGQVRNEQLQWIKQDFAKNEASAQPGQLRGLFAHNNPIYRDRDLWPQSDPEVQQYWKEYDRQHNPQTPVNLALGEKLGLKYDQLWHGEGAKEIVDLMNQYRVQVSLHGHTHIDNVTQKDGVLYITTTAIELTGKPWIGFRNFVMNNGQPTGYNYEEPGHSIPVYQNGVTRDGIMSFQADYAAANDGHASSQTATVTNRLNKPITVTVPFYMTAGNYKVSTGTLKQNYAADGQQYLEVEVAIPANASQKITVQK